MLLINLINTFVQHNSNFKKIDKIIKNLQIHNLMSLHQEILSQFSIVFTYNNNILGIHLFIKSFNSDELNFVEGRGIYLKSIFLEDSEECKYDYNWKLVDKKSNEINLDDNPDNFLLNISPDVLKDNLKIEYLEIYDDSYYFGTDVIIENEVNFASDSTMEILKYIESGFYFDLDDVRWQIILRHIISSEIGYKGNLSKYFKSNKYKSYPDVKSIYMHKYDNESIYETIILKDLTIQCDKCNYRFTKNDHIWHNHYCGDLCDKCYNNKKNLEYERINYLKKIILNEGKKVIFQSDLNKTKDFLNNYQIKNIEIKNKLNLLEKFNNQLQNHIKDIKKKNICCICHEFMFRDLSAGKCGHCYHTSCISLITENKCPICRTSTNFIKLYL